MRSNLETEITCVLSYSFVAPVDLLKDSPITRGCQDTESSVNVYSSFVGSATLQKTSGVWSCKGPMLMSFVHGAQRGLQLCWEMWEKLVPCLGTLASQETVKFHVGTCHKEAQ